MNFIWILFTFVISYFLGGINFSIIISKFTGKKQDIRCLGSQNAGFTNALRSLGILPAIMTFLGDFVKGMACSLIGKSLIYKCGINSDYKFLFLILLGFFCCLGHMWPCFFGFKGGKGILTTWAFSLFLDWKIFVSLISIFLIVMFLYKIISLASIISAIAYPILVFIFTNNLTFSSHMISSIVALIWSSIIIIKHRSNIQRLISGDESKIKIKTNKK